MIETHSKSGSAELSNLLAAMNSEGNFVISVITDCQGFPIASAADSGQSPETQAAVVALVQKTAAQVRNQLGMAETDEISLFAADGQRLVCRPFNANGHEMILAVLVPDRQKSYRRLTSQTIITIRQAWRL